ncbi:permease [Rhodococcus sp. MSC1_016]|jgi:hypothetical protein|uniref:permease n=1 Tax=Rhodococcus sp. MSC1_016 TaxID=2909266 RepID=UPI00203044D9|nr:permease [Rhodococcus sp. MSC1_016]
MVQHDVHTVAGSPPEARVNKWSLAMAWWSLFSAMFWLYISAASAAAYGPRSTVIGLVLTIATYGVINRILAAHAIRTGNTVEGLSHLLFGRLGATLAALLLAATALYYGVFEGSVIAVSLQSWFGGDIRIWYAVCVAYAMPLAFGGVRHWLDRLNGFLLPFYVVGLVALVVAATVKQGYPAGWLTSTVPTPGALPGWLGSYLIFMGVWVMMMFTLDFAALGRDEDTTFHRRITFGPLFYLCTFGVNGLIGIYVVTAFGTTGTERGVVDAVIGSLGFAGVLLIVVSQTRINTANYYLASTNLEAVARATLRIRLPHIVWVIVCGIAAYSLMLTDVLAYLLQALAWQAVLIVAWVSVCLTHLVCTDRPALTASDKSDDTPASVTPLIAAWILASAVGIALQQQTSVDTLSQLSPLVTVVVGAVLSLLLGRRGSLSNVVLIPVSSS